MNEQVWWYASRSSGIIAWVLITLSILWGLSLSTRITGNKPTPAWLLDLHRMLGGLSVVFTGIHLLGLYFDSYLEFGLLDFLVPLSFQAYKPGAVAVGVVAFYMMVAIQLSSVFMRKLPRKVWRYIHFSAWPLFIMATWHGLWAGTDVQNVYYRWTGISSVQLVAFLTIVRAMAQKKARRRAARPAPSAAPAAEAESPGSYVQTS